MLDLSGCSILIVEDAIENLDILVDTLSADYNISVAVDGESALESVAETAPDLVLLDILLPGMDGYEVCARLKADLNTKDIPVIFISKLDETLDKVKAFKLGAVDYIPKPYQYEEVQARVRVHLELKMALINMQRLGELKDNLVRMVVHDLRSPLSAVHLALTLLGDPPDPQALEPKMWNTIRSQTHYAMELCEMLLDINRLQQNKLPVKPACASVKNTIRSAAEGLQQVAENKQVRIAMEVTDHLFTTDHSLLKRILLNLLSNAIKYVPIGTDVVVNGKVNNGNLELAVSDYGKGIPEQYYQQIFILFGSAENNADARGTGVGLAFCKLAVEALNGNIDLESIPGVRTTFRVSLPQSFEM